MDELQIINDDAQAQDLQKLEHQILMARKYPRDWDLTVAEVSRRASREKKIAEECFYSLPKGGKKIEGPSVRFAELIFASLYNVRIGTRIVEITATDITGECIIYDLQTNKQINVRETKSIQSKNKQTGKMVRYSNDMVMTTGKAAVALARRNCIFQAVPMVEFEETLKQVKQIATGKINPPPSLSEALRGDAPQPLSLEARRANALEFFDNQGIDEDRVLWALQLTVIEDIDEEALESLVGFRTALKDDMTTVADIFPPTPKEANKKRATGVTDEIKKG